jgi:phage baseplate assembly protein W
MKTDFLGKGFAWPLGLHAQKGIRVSGQAQRVQESMRIILGTQYGERLMRPRFGCNLKSLLFAPNNATTANLARFYVEEGLKTWEPRIQLEEIRVENHNEDACLFIHVRYRIRSSNEPGNFVYPFYLQQP